MIHVCFGLYDATGRYSKMTGTTILSMFENTRAEVTVHLLHDNTLTADNRDKFLDLARQYNQLIKFYNVEELCAAEIQQFKTLFSEHKMFQRFTIGAMFRLLMPHLILDDIEKIIYLDSDIILNIDINELWQIPLEDKPIVAIPEIQNGIPTGEVFTLYREGIVNVEDYFNSGVLVINLEKWRGSEYQTLQNGIKFVVENIKDMWIDQNILNYCFSKNYLKLPSKFNFFVRDSRRRNEFETDNRIIHYLANTLTGDERDPFNALWFSYFEKTPWFNPNVIPHFYETLVTMHVELKDFAALVSMIMSGKSRVFFVDKVNIELMHSAFFVKEDEKIIVAKNLNYIQLLKDSIRASKGKELYFILTPSWYGKIHAELIKDGFVEGRDFVDAMSFLSELHGVPLEKYDFVKAM